MISRLFYSGYIVLEACNRTAPSMAYQRLALVYIVLALGSKMNPEIQPDDPSSQRYYQFSQECLSLGNFLVDNSLITVQTLSLMAKFAAYANIPDTAWQIRGIAMRILIAMGLHRDGQKWNLPVKVLNDRRRTFWETYSTDVLISSNWDRPSGLHQDLFDTKLPDDYEQGTGFEKQRCHLSMLCQEALQESLKVQSNYTKLREIWHKTRDLESAMPFNLRNRAALKFMVSKYPTLADVEANTPPPSRNLRVVFQSHDLIDNACILVLSLFRPYFVHAVQTADPSSSPYADAYLAVIERSGMLIANLRSLHSLFPLVSTRHWFFWNHAFSGAVCMATICIAHPSSPLADQALNALDSLIALYSSIGSSQHQKRWKRHLQWLSELRTRGHENMEAFRAGHPVPEGPSPESSLDESPEHIQLLGWRKKLVELGQRADDVTGFIEPEVASSLDLNSLTPSSDIVSEK